MKKTDTEKTFSSAPNASLLTMRPSLAAIFIDFENIYYEIKTSISHERDASPFILSMLLGLKDTFTKAPHHSPAIITKAYADFDAIEESVLGSLYLMGVETMNVMGTDQKNSADMRLAIDVMEILYTRPEIANYILFAGDRDYIPLVQHLNRMNKSIFIVSLTSNLSGDLRMNVEKDHFLDATMLLSDIDHKKLQTYRAEYTRALDDDKAHVHENGIAVTMPSGRKGTAVGLAPTEDSSAFEGLANKLMSPAVYAPITEPSLRKALKFILERYGQHREVFLSNVMRELSNEMPSLADYERRALIGTLESHGAIRTQKKHGNPFDYTVAILNYNHPTIREFID